MSECYIVNSLHGVCYAAAIYSNCSMSLSSHGQALMPPPPEAYYQAQPIAPSSQPRTHATTRIPAALPTTVQPPTVNAQRPKKKEHGLGLPCPCCPFHVASAHVHVPLLLWRGPEFMANRPTFICLFLLPPASLHFLNRISPMML